MSEVSFEPGDILFEPPVNPASMEVLMDVMPETEPMGYLDGFTYHVALGTWVCDDCKALTVDALGHADWHERTREALTQKTLID